MSGDDVVDEPETAPEMTFRDYYEVNPPFGFVGIALDEETGNLRYLTLEPTLTEEEQEILLRLKGILIERMDIPLSVLKDEESMEAYLRDQIQRAFRRFKRQVAKESEDKYIYYLKRDFLGYGKIDLLMLDPNIEDISCNGLETPLYIWHRNHESIPTNIIYESPNELDAIVTRLAYKAGRQISVARPILEGTLPEGYRVHLTLDEVSTRGDTFTIRKFRHNPYTIVDLIRFGTVSASVAAYLWVLVDNLRSVMISGATASGKTTLLNLLGGIDKPTEGKITVAGNKLDELNAKQLNKFRRTEVGFIFQFYNLIPTLTALENVILGIEAVIQDKNELRKRAEKYLELVGLSDKRDNIPQELSAGEQQRVAIARALAKEPKLILADEPTGNLDEDRGEKIMALMQKLQKELKMTFLIVSHNSSLKKYANKTLILRRGKLSPT